MIQDIISKRNKKQLKQSMLFSPSQPVSPCNWIKLLIAELDFFLGGVLLKIFVFIPVHPKFPKTRWSGMRTVSESWLCCWLPWELGSLIAVFGVCFIYVEIVLSPALCFVHVKNSFQKVQEMALKLHKGTNGPSFLWAIVWPGQLGWGRLSSSALLVEFALSHPRLNPPGSGKVSSLEPRGCFRSLGIWRWSLPEGPGIPVPFWWHWAGDFWVCEHKCSN